MNRTWARLGAVCYVIWGLLHLKAAYSVYQVGAAVPTGMVQGRLYQDAWNLLFFAIAAIGLACTLNWRASRWGFWINLGVISLADTGFIFFVLVPGFMGWWPGVLGPVFWIAGWILTGLGLDRRVSAVTMS